MVKTIKQELEEQGFKKVIRKIGGSAGVLFNKAEIEKHGLNIGKMLNLDDAFVEREENDEIKDN